MQDINVLVVFCSRTGRTEKLALAAAVGAVQARANIRLRWLREAADDRTIESLPEWKENRERMEKEYIAPRAVDAEWADAIMIAARGSASSASRELKDYLGSLDGRAEPVFIDVASLENARLQGRHVTDAARAEGSGLVGRFNPEDHAVGTSRICGFRSGRGLAKPVVSSRSSSRRICSRRDLARTSRTRTSS